MTILSLIAAMAKDRVIGADNTLPWQLPEDLKHFKTTTLGKPVIMGRKTWESLGRPLPGRRNIVISRNAGYSPTGGELAPSLPAAIAMAAEADEVFVIGGADIYRQALPMAQRIYLTEIALNVAGDTHFPEISPADWSEVSRETQTSAGGIQYAFVLYQHR